MHIDGQHRHLVRVAVLAHGSGSTAEFARRAFAGALAAEGVATVAIDDRSGDVSQVADRLGRVVDAFAAGRATQVWVGGVSLGAHAAAVVAASRPWLHGVLIAMPAWTGPAAEVAGRSAAAARDLRRDGLAPTLDRLSAAGWVGEELARAWPSYGLPQLVAALEATSRSAGPTPAQLSAIEPPTGLYATPDDPFHPVEVAALWARLIPRSHALVQRVDPAEGALALGRQTLRAWHRAAVDSPFGPVGGVGGDPAVA